MRNIWKISTHTPHAGRDDHEYRLTLLELDFYSHAPCGARQILNISLYRVFEFLLTRPMRGATALAMKLGDALKNFYSHAPCGARPAPARAAQAGGNFYSHAPCGARRQRQGTGQGW